MVKTFAIVITDYGTIEEATDYVLEQYPSLDREEVAQAIEQREPVITGLSRGEAEEFSEGFSDLGTSEIIPWDTETRSIEGEDVFGFMVVRPPVEPDRNAVIRPVAAEDSTLVADLVEVSDKPDARAEMIRIAQEFIKTEVFVDEFPDELSELDSVLTDRDASMAEVAAITTELFDASPSALLKREVFDDLRDRLGNSLLAVTVLPGEQSEAELLRGVRVLHILEEAANTDTGERDISDLLDRTVALPDELFPLPGSPPSETTVSSDMSHSASQNSELVSQIRKRINAIRSARAELLGTSIESGDDLASFSTITDVDNIDRSTGDISINEPVIDDVRDSVSPETAVVLEDLDRGVTIRTALSTLEDTANELISRLTSIHRRSKETSVVRFGDNYYQMDDSQNSAASTTSESTDRAGVIPLGFGDLEIVRQRLLGYKQNEIAHIENALKGESKERTHRHVQTSEESYRYEQETQTEREEDLESTQRFEVEHEAEEAIHEQNQLDAGLQVSASYGPTVEIEAHADYSQQSVRDASTQTATSFAHEVTSRVTERVKETIQEERSWRRSETIEEMNTHGIENKDGDDHVTGIYRWIQKQYEAQVFNYGTRFLVEFFVPEPAAMYLESRVSNPAERLTIEKPTPPTASWRTPSEGEQNPPLLTIDDITPTTYKDVVGEYNVSGVSPPPAPVAYVSTTDKPEADPSDREEIYRKHLSLSVPDGYESEEVAITFIRDMKRINDSHNGFVTVTFSRNVGYVLTLDDKKEPLDEKVRSVHDLEEGEGTEKTGETGTIPVIISTKNVKGMAAAFQLKCTPTARTMEQWQLSTFHAIQTAYEKQKTAYDDKLAAAAMEVEDPIAEHSPERNREIERTELKRGAIELLHGDALKYELIDDTQLYPKINMTKMGDQNQLNTMTFLEQAFEWPQMTYIYYPYFWARQESGPVNAKRKRWYEMLQLEVDDPLFTQFLQAGAARVVVPVRPGFKNDVLYFLQHKIPYSGTGRPKLEDMPVGNDRFVSIVEELKGQQEADQTDVPVSDSWQVTLPTSLVSLQADNQLPQFDLDP